MSFEKAIEAMSAAKPAAVAETVEPKVAEIETATDKPKDNFSSNFERISKQEKHNAEVRKQLEEKRKAFETDKADLEKYRQFDKDLQTDPLSVLERLGLPLSKIQQLAQQKQTPANPEARQAIELAKKLEAELKARDARDEEKTKSQADIRLNTSIAEEVRNGGYDIIEHLGMESAVREYMEAYYDETGEIPEIKDACEAIAKDIASKVSKVTKSKWLSPLEEMSQKLNPVAGEATKIKASATLSNKMTQSTEKTIKPMTDADRLKAASDILKYSK